MPPAYERISTGLGCWLPPRQQHIRNLTIVIKDSGMDRRRRPTPARSRASREPEAGGEDGRQPDRRGFTSDGCLHPVSGGAWCPVMECKPSSMTIAQIQ